MLNDQDTYTGVDEEPKGSFDNEIKNEEVEKKIQDQQRLIKELTPKLQDLLSVIDSEIASVMNIDRFITATLKPESDIRAELQASALYKQYLGNLKTKFARALDETKK